MARKAPAPRSPGRQTRVIALIAPKGPEYSLRLIEGVLSVTAGNSRCRFIDVPCDKDGSKRPQIDALDVDGVLSWKNPVAPWVLELRDRGTKMVSLNPDWVAEGIPCVGMDPDANVRKGLEHLARLGRRHAAYIDHRSRTSPSRQRKREAFLAGARSRGWSAAVMEVAGTPSEERKRLTQPQREKELVTFIRRLPLPAVAFCDDDYVAALVCGVAGHLGLSVPGDIAVLGQFDLAITRFSVPTISSCPNAGQGVGAAGMHMLNDILAGRPAPTRPLLVKPPPVVCRESTGGTTVRDDDLARAHEMIQKFACQGLTAQQLIQRVAASQKTFNRRYEAAYGRTLGAAIRHARVEKAKGWLATTDLSVGRIADLCGFDEATNFIAFFRREVGCTPGDYRARARETRSTRP